MVSIGVARQAFKAVLGVVILLALFVSLPSAIMAQSTDTEANDRVLTISTSNISTAFSACMRCSHYASFEIPHRAKITSISVDYEYTGIFADVELQALHRLQAHQQINVISPGFVTESQCFTDCIVTRQFNFRVDNVDWEYRVRVMPLGNGEISPQRIRISYQVPSIQTEFLDLGAFAPVSTSCQYQQTGSGALVINSGCTMSSVLDLPDGVKIESIDPGYIGNLTHISIYAETRAERFLVARVSASECYSGDCQSQLFGGLYSTTLSVIDNNLYNYIVEIEVGVPTFLNWQPFTLDRLAVLYR